MQIKLANPPDPDIEPHVGALRIVGGARLDAASHGAVVLTAPPEAARGREGEHLFILLDLNGPARPHLHRELREALAQIYWSTTGSVTAALRRAASAANRHLFRSNLRAPPSNRWYGGLVCAVVRGSDLFILQAGPAQACIHYEDGNYLKRLTADGDLPPLGMGPLADVWLFHSFVTLGDTLLLISSRCMEIIAGGELSRILSGAQVQEILARLERAGAGVDFTALVARWAPPREEPATAGTAATPHRTTILARLRREAASRSATQAPPQVERRPPEPRQPSRSTPEPQPEPRALPKPARKPGPSFGERVGELIEGAARSVTQAARLAGRGIAAIGRGLMSVGIWLVGAITQLFRRMLPGSARGARARARPARPVPKENRAVMISLAVSIPILLAIVVLVAYTSFGKDARFQRLIKQAQEEIALAQAAGDGAEDSRPHWEAALEYARQAAARQPDHPEAAALEAQAQAALDLLDGVVRLSPIPLWDLGPGSARRRIVVHGQMIFVLDPAAGWVAQLTLNPAGDAVIEQEIATILVHTGQAIGERAVGDLVDFTWVELSGGRQTSGLLILEEDGALINYDPAWGDEGSDFQLTHSLLGTLPEGTAQAVDSFRGRFYILDPVAGQIWRYEPRGDTYPNAPERYFVTPPPKSLSTAVDMAIDGNIYVLYDDGAILKFLGGEPQPMDVRGLPGNIGQAVDITVDPAGVSEGLYIADRGNNRVVALESDGAFRVQFRAERAFDALETLAINEATRRLYVVSGSQLYVASLP